MAIPELRTIGQRFEWGRSAPPAQPNEVQYNGITLRDQVYRRAGHISWVYEGQVCFWGGVVEHIYNRPKGPNRTPANGNSFHEPNFIITFEPTSGRWGRCTTGGSIPPPTAGALSAFASDTRTLYIYGGLVQEYMEDEYVQSTSRDLYELEMETLTWKRLSPTGEWPPPAEKGVAWIHKGEFYLFGGYSDDLPDDVDHYQVHAEPFMQGWGWTNFLVKYQPESNRWIWPKSRGEKPSPRAGSAAGLVGDILTLFGGREKESRINDLYTLDLDTLTWFCIDRGSPGLVWEDSLGIPMSRSLHTFTTLPDGSLLLYGGISKMSSPLNDCWIYSHQDGCWQEVPLRYDHGEVRCWHSTALSKENDIIIHSGLTQEFYLTRMDLDDHCESVLQLEMGVHSLFRLSLDSVQALTSHMEECHINSLGLPNTVKKMLLCRMSGDQLVHMKPPPKEAQYTRRRLHAGI